MTLKTTQKILSWLGRLLLVITLVLMIFEPAFLLIPFLVISIAVVVISIKYNRCPSCNRWLRVVANNCPYCGEKLDMKDETK